MLGRDSIHHITGITVNEKKQIAVLTIGIHFYAMMKYNQFVTNLIIW